MKPATRFSVTRNMGLSESTTDTDTTSTSTGTGAEFGSVVGGTIGSQYGPVGGIGGFYAGKVVGEQVEQHVERSSRTWNETYKQNAQPGTGVDPFAKSIADNSIGFPDTEPGDYGPASLLTPSCWQNKDT
jgi:hypothetical protein